MTAHSVIDDPTFAVRWHDGTVSLVGLRALLCRAHEISDLVTETPPGYAAIRRILAALTYRVTGLDERMTVKAWRARRDEALTRGRLDPALIDDYLDRWSHRFQLFGGDRPWMQDPRLEAEADKEAVVALMTPWISSGVNGTTLFAWGADSEAFLDVAGTVEALLVRLAFGAAGRMPSRTLPDGTRSATGYAAPLYDLNVYLPVGATLAVSLLASLVPAPANLPTTSVPDSAVWERDLPDPTEPLAPTTGIVDLLSGRHQHAVLLGPPDADGYVWKAWTSWATQTKDAYPIHADPSLQCAWKAQKDKPLVLVAQRAPRKPVDVWRELPSLLPTTQPGNASGDTIPPAVVSEMATLPSSVEPLQICVVGYAMQQSKSLAWFRSDTPDLHQALWDPTTGPDTMRWRTGIATWVGAYEAAHRRLSGALKSAQAATGAESSGWAARAETQFWQECRNEFNAVIESAPDATTYAADAAANASEDAIALARTVYDRITRDHLTGRGARVIVKKRP